MTYSICCQNLRSMLPLGDEPPNPEHRTPKLTVLYCAITALDGYPSHSDNIHYIQLVTLIYVLPPFTNQAIHHFRPQHSSHPPFASSRHLPMPELSHPNHVIGSFVTGTSITSACQEAGPNPVVPSLRRQVMECGGNRDNGDSKWRQSATQRQ